MGNRITLSDYNADWAYKNDYQHARTHPGYLTAEEVVAFYGTVGVDGVELTHCYWKDCPASRVRKLAADAGLPVVCYVFDADLAQPPSSVQFAIEEARRRLDRTAELGARFAMITPAVVKPGVPLNEQRKWVIEGLRACAEHGISVGVTVCIENLDDPPGRPLAGQGRQCREICAAVDSPGLRLIYDCGAALFVDEDPLGALREMAPFVVHVHLKNSRQVRAGEQVERYLDSDRSRRYTGSVLDDGAVNVEAVVAELLRMRYNGFLLIEYQGVDDPRAAVAHNVQYLKRLLGSLNRKS